MSRTPSIPLSLEPALLRRWVEGTSPRALHRWIEESNATRKTPITTSVSSVLRCLERAAARNSSLACLASVHRSRLRSSALMDQLEEVDDGYRAVVTSAENTGREFVNHRLHARLKALGKLELSAHRQLKLAGVGTAFGHKLAADHLALTREMARDIAAEDELEDAGLPPEITVRHMPPELLPPAPLTPEIMAAMRREQLRAMATLSESKPLVSQPIIDSNRSTSTPPPGVSSTSMPGQAPPASPTVTSTGIGQPTSTSTQTAAATSGAPTLSESKPLHSQPIADLNRITSPRSDNVPRNADPARSSSANGDPPGSKHH